MARRPINPFEAAEAAFKPAKKAAPPPAKPVSAAPEARETVSIRLDRAVLDHFQEDGPGWQDRINEALREIVSKR